MRAAAAEERDRPPQSMAIESFRRLCRVLDEFDHFQAVQLGIHFNLGWLGIQALTDAGLFVR